MCIEYKLLGLSVFMVVLQLLHSVHDLDGPSQLDAKALDQGLVGEQEERYPVHLLLLKEVHITCTVARRLEVLHDLCYAPLANIGGKTCMVKTQTTRSTLS